MAYHQTGVGARQLVPAALSRPDPPCARARLDLNLLRQGVTLRRDALAGLEAELAVACETAAGLRAGCRPGTPTDRGAWDRADWRRYLDAAAALEASYGPRMRRLWDDVARLERLIALVAAG